MPYHVTPIGPLKMNSTEVCIYVLFGSLLGLAGALLVTCLKYLTKVKKYLFLKTCLGPYSYSLGVLVLHQLFYMTYNYLGLRPMIIIFDEKHFAQFQLTEYGLIIEWVGLFMLHLLTLTCNIPCGNLVPLFTLGGIAGKIYYPFAKMMGS